VLAACATPLLVAASSVAAAGTAAAVGYGPKKVHDPDRVTGTIHGHCSYRDHGQLPDPHCTPALREQMTARRAKTKPMPGMRLCQLVEVPLRIRWETEFRERLAMRKKHEVKP